MIWQFTNEMYDEVVGKELGIGLFNSSGLLESHSPDFFMFLSQEGLPPSILNCHLLELFPELIGYEETLEAVQKKQEDALFIERIFRPTLRGKPGYITLRVKEYRGGWLALLRDTTATGEMEQRITQQRNELMLLSTELEKTRSKLDRLLRTFVPTAVVDNLLKKNTANLGGERRFVTVLFADLRSYTAWAETRSPEEAILRLNQLLSSAFEILSNNGATINQLMGDGFMSIFNAPVDQPRHASLALDSAWQIADLPGMSEEVRFGVGVNTGFAMVGNVGSARAMDYSAIGTTTNIAYRLQQLAGPGEALFGEKTLELVGSQFRYVSHGEFGVKGIQAPIPVYKLIR